MRVRARTAAAALTVALPLLAASAARAAFVVDPICATNCADRFCGDTPQTVFANCAESCEATWNICPALSHCFEQCDEQRDFVAARCRASRQRCVRKNCRVRVPRARAAPAAVGTDCQEDCRQARPDCLGNVRKAKRHCLEKCHDGCGDYPFPRALGRCLEHCRDTWVPEDICQARFETCVDNCGGR